MTANPSPEELLGELARLREETRTRRHGYWFPLVVFGLGVCAASASYVSVQIPDFLLACDQTTGYLCGSTSVTPSFVTAMTYWTLLLLAASVATGLWYPWHAEATGVATRVSASIWLWVLGTVVGVGLTVALTTWIAVHSADLPWLRQVAGPLRHGFGPMLGIAIGFAVLSWLERSRALLAITTAFLGVVLVGSAESTPNIASNVVSFFNKDLGPAIGTAAVIAVPGLVLLISGLIILATETRRS